MQHTDVWNELFVPMHCLNFGVHRDKIENVLWRIENGELENINPKIVVLHVGTNNYENTAEEIAEGVLVLVNTIREKQPEAYIVVPVR